MSLAYIAMSFPGRGVPEDGRVLVWPGKEWTKLEAITAHYQGVQAVIHQGSGRVLFDTRDGDGLPVTLVADGEGTEFTFLVLEVERMELASMLLAGAMINGDQSRGGWSAIYSLN